MHYLSTYHWPARKKHTKYKINVTSTDFLVALIAWPLIQEGDMAISFHLRHMLRLCDI